MAAADRQRRIGSFCVAAAAWAALGASAQETATGTTQADATQARAVVGIGHGRSDNLGRDGTGERVSSSFNALRLNFLLNRDRPRLLLNFAGDVDFRRYQDVPPDSDANDIRGSIDGLAVARLISDTLTWDFRESFGQIRRNVFDVDRPGNREHVTVFSTGPRLNLPLGARSFLTASVQGSQRAYEDSVEYDSDSTVASLGLYRNLSPVSRLGLQLTSNEIDYNAAAQVDFEVDSAYLSYSKELATGGVQISVGGSEITLPGRTQSTQLLRFSWNRDIGGRSNLSVFGGREYTDAGGLFRSGGGVSGLNGFGSLGGYGGGGLFDVRRLQDSRLSDVLLTSNPLERSNLTVGWRVTGQRTTFFVSAGAWQDRFEVDSSLDNDGTHADLELTREFSPRWSGRIAVRAYRRDFELTSRQQDDVTSYLSTTFELGARAGITAEYRRYSRDSNTVGSTGFDENLYSVFFNYTFGQ